VTDIKIYWNKETNSKNLIGQRVRELRTERQLSQKALAEQLQLAGYEFNDLTVLRIEQGTRFVPDYEVVALAEFFHVSCEYLLGVQNKK
jgi:transcriptional regulator with XRE-family HTH domain